MRIILQFSKAAQQIVSKDDIDEKFLDHGIGVCGKLNFSADYSHDYFNYLWDLPIVLVAATAKEVSDIDATRIKYSNNDDVMVMWVGESEKPTAKAIPIFSQNQLDQASDKLEWVDLTRLAAQPDCQPV